MRIDNIVVGVDFSAGSDLAAETALQIARRHSARIHLTFAGTVPELANDQGETSFSVAARAMVAAELDEARDKLQTLRARLNGQGAEIAVAVIDGPPASGLARAAQELGADLIVVGSYGRSGVDRLFLGSVAEKLVRKATVPVLVVRPGLPAEGSKRTLVPVDFSDRTERALAVLPTIVAAKAKIDLFHVWAAFDISAYNFAWMMPGGLDSVRQAICQDLEKQGEVLKARLAELSAEIHFIAEEGRPADTILKRAVDGQHDLIVIGSHGRHGPGRWLLGSVAERVVRHASCSVLIVRTAGESAN